MSFLNLVSEAAEATEVTAAGGILGVITMVIPLALMVLVFWFFIIRPEKKRSKDLQSMMDSLQVADEVVTNGGIIGLVVSVQKDTVLIETGSDRTKIRILKSAIAKCNTTHDDTAEPKPKAKKDIK